MTRLEGSTNSARNSTPGRQARSDHPKQQHDIVFGSPELCASSNLLEQVGLESQGMHDEDQAFQRLLSEQLHFTPAPAEPTPDCLSDVETLDFEQGGVLGPDRLAHVERCSWCQSMLVGIIHGGDGFWEELRRRQAEAAARTSKSAVSATSEG